MSNTNVETVTSTFDRAKLILAVLVIVAGIVSFSVLESKPTVVRVGIFIASLIIAAVIAWLSEPGRRAISFGRDSYNETKRVVWPERKESTRMTLMVFGFVIAMGALLWIVDKILGWVIYALLLGWR
jgi:preprotein translocase subunit SecE